jgi:PAS domain-containing protein
VFILNSFNRGYTWTDNMLRGIDDAFDSSGIKLEQYVVFMDTKRIPPTPQYFSRLKELIRLGYGNVRFDALLACDNDALEFMRSFRDELFPGVPLVFSSINDYDKRMLDGRTDITGTSENTDYAGTIRTALALRPETQTIVVVTDATTTGKAHRSAIEKIRSELPEHLAFKFVSLADMTLDELGTTLSHLDERSVVLLVQHFVDSTGTTYSVQESTPILAERSSVPVFVTTDIRVGYGTLGGVLVSGYHHGFAAAMMVARILNGADVRSIPVLLKSPNKHMFDYLVMERFRISERSLPAESIVINKPVSLLYEYRPQLFSIAAAFAMLCGLLLYLLLQIRRRKRAEETLRESEGRLRLTAEAGNVGLWDWDLRSNRVHYSTV